MPHCVNINHPEIEPIAEKFNFSKEDVGAVVSVWQEKNNIYDRFPTIEEFQAELVPVKESDKNSNQVNYSLKAVNILLSDKAKQVFDKGEKAKWDLNKILTELQVPKDQKQLLLNFGIKDREQLALELASKYEFSVEINTTKEKSSSVIRSRNDDGDFTYNGNNYLIAVLPNKTIYYKNNEQITKEEYEEAAINYGLNLSDLPTQYYSNLTVPGGTNYTENEISTPLITPSIKGHAQFATDQGIGWFRSDDKAIGGEYLPYERTEADIEEGIPAYTNTLMEGLPTKTRRILEIQSDLFQKGRDKEDLISGKEQQDYYNSQYNDNIETFFDADNNEYFKIEDGKKTIISEKKFNTINEIGKSPKNKFLQLLNKDNNWVTFFIKSIIQDSAKKGYEKVLFPKGETAARIEGHETIADEIRKYNKLIEEEDTAIQNAKEVKKWIVSNDVFGYGTEEEIEFFNEKEANNFADKKGKDWFVRPEFTTKESIINFHENKKQQFEQKKAELKSQGVEKLKPIEAFYEIKIGNILEKQFGKDNVKTITDEYGNQWREIQIDKNRDLKQPIVLGMQFKRTIADDVIDYNNQLRQFHVGDLTETIEVGRPRRILKSLGLENKPIRIDQEALKSMLDKHKEMKLVDLFDLPDAINNPIMVLKGNNYQTNKDSLWIMTSLKNRDGFYIDTVIKLTHHEKSYDINSIYPRYSIFGTLKSIEEGDLLFANKTKALEYFKSLQEKADTSWPTWSPFLKKTNLQQFKDIAKNIEKNIASFKNTISDTQVYEMRVEDQIEINQGNPDAYLTMKFTDTNLDEANKFFGFKGKTFNNEEEASNFIISQEKELKKQNSPEFQLYQDKFDTVTGTDNEGKFYVALERKNTDTIYDSVHGKINKSDAKNIINEVLSNDSVQKILDSLISNNLISDEIKPLLDKLNKINPEITYFSDPNNTNLLQTDGVSIQINKAFLDKAHPKLLAEGIIHELVHIYTVGAIENPQNEEEQLLSKRINYAFNQFKRLDTQNRYGGTNASEFVAELMSKTEFRNYVKTLENGSLWQRILNFIADLFGIKTGSKKLVEKLEYFIQSSEPVIESFSIRGMEVDSATRKSLELIINSIGTRIKALQNRVNETKRKDEKTLTQTEKTIQDYEVLMTQLNDDLSKNLYLKGIIAYIDNMKKYIKEMDDVVNTQRKIANEGDYGAILKQSSVLMSLGNFANSNLNIAKELKKNLREIKLENSESDKTLKKIKKAIGSIDTNMGILKNDYIDISRIVFAKFLYPMGMGRSVGHITNMLKTPVNDISFMARWFMNMQESGDEALGLIDAAIKKYYQLANDEIIEYEIDLLQEKKKLEKAGIKDSKWLIKKHNGKNTHYFVTERDIVQFRSLETQMYKEIEGKTEAYKRDKIKQFYQKYAINEKHNYVTFDKLLTEKRAELGDNYDSWEQLNVIKHSDGTRSIPRIIDPEYFKLHENKLKSDFYWKIINSKRELEKEYPDAKKHLRRLPQMRKDLVERIKDGNWKGILEMVKEDLQIKEDDTDYGNKSELLDESGNVIQYLPIYFNTKIKDPENMSEDIVSSMIGYASVAIKRKKLSRILDTLEIGKDVIKERGVLKVDKAGRNILSIKNFTGKKTETPVTEPTPGAIYDRLNDYLNMFVYGRMKKEGKTIPVLNITSEKLIDLLAKYTSIRMLAGNVYQMMSNTNTGTLMTMMEAIDGKFFNKKAWGFAESAYWGNVGESLMDIGTRIPTRKLNVWMKFMDTMNNFDEHIYSINADRTTKASQLIGGSALYFTSSIPEHYLHNRVSLALADTYRYDSKNKKFIFENEFYKPLKNLKELMRKDMEKLPVKPTAQQVDEVKSKYKNQIKNLQDNLDGQWKKMTNFWDAHEVKNNRLVLKEEFEVANYSDTKDHFVRRLHGVNNTIQGMYSKLDRSAIQQFALGRLLMMFRKWMIPAWNKRFQKKYTDFEKQMDEEGYYRIFGRFIKQLHKDLKEHQFSIRKNWNILTDEERSAIHRVFYDVSVFITIAATASILMGLSDDDDDNWALNMMAYQVRRLQTETGALIPPFMFFEGLNVVRSPTAGANAFQELTQMMTSMNWFDLIERGKYEGMYIWQRNLIRTVPLGENIYSIMYPEEKIKYFTTTR